MMQFTIFSGGEMITIKSKTREKTTKGSVKQCRREGHIPYIVYSNGQTKEMGTVLKADINTLLRSIRFGFLCTTKLMLQNDAGHERPVVVKDIQYHPTTYEILHLDFLELEEGCPIKCKVPIDCINTVDCVGVKLGGMLRTVLRHVKVKCLPKNIPSHFEIDVKDLGMRESKRVEDISLPEGVKCLANPRDVLVSVVKK